MVVGAVISGLDEEWRRGTLALADLEQRLTVTLASSGDAVLTTDEHGDILTLNEVAEALTGWPSVEAIGRPVEEALVIVPPARHLLPQAQVGMSDAWTRREPDSQTMLVSRDG